MKHYNTTRNIKRKLRNLTRRIKAGRKSRLLFKTGDLGKNLSKMTKKVIQRGGAMDYSGLTVNDFKRNDRPHMDINVDQLIGALRGGPEILQIKKVNSTFGSAWQWTDSSAKEIGDAFNAAQIAGNLTAEESGKKIVTNRKRDLRRTAEHFKKIVPETSVRIPTRRRIPDELINATKPPPQDAVNLSEAEAGVRSMEDGFRKREQNRLFGAAAANLGVDPGEARAMAERAERASLK